MKAHEKFGVRRFRATVDLHSIKVSTNVAPNEESTASLRLYQAESDNSLVVDMTADDLIALRARIDRALAHIAVQEPLVANTEPWPHGGFF